jgi:hypothetical protein
MGTKEKTKKEVVVKIPEHLVEAGKLVLQKVAGKYKISCGAADCSCSKQQCACDCSAMPDPEEMQKLIKDIKTMHQKINELTKHMNARYGELNKILSAYPQKPTK